MATQVKSNAQMSFDEETIDDPDLLERMRRWKSLDEKHKAAKKDATVVAAGLKATVQQKELGPGTYRIGEFKIKIKDTEAAHREFDIAPKRQISFAFDK